jgi:hypothetical protein
VQPDGDSKSRVFAKLKIFPRSLNAPVNNAWGSVRGLLIKEVEDNHFFKLMWARNEERYKSVMSALRSEYLMTIQSDDKIHRTLTRLNKQLDSELLWLERLALQKAQALVIEDQSGLPSKEQEVQMIDA